MKCSFIVLRTPLLPFDTLSDWADGARAAAAWQASDEELAGALHADRDLLRARLRRLVLQADVKEALSLSSSAMAEVLRGPGSKRFEQAEAAFVRYLVRMSTRPTPFGLMAGVSSGDVARATRLELAPHAQYRRRTRLDGAFIAALGDALVRNPELRRGLVFRPNPDLYEHAGELRYFVSTASDARSLRLTAVECSPWLDAALARARRGARPAQIARALTRRRDPRASAFVEAMIDARVLIADAEAPASGDDPLAAITRALERGGSACRDAAAELARVEAMLREADAGGLVAGDELRASVTQKLSRFAPRNSRPLFQVDLLKPAPGLCIDARVVAEVRSAIQLLHAIKLPSPDASLAHFRDAYERRYGSQRVRLVDALDPEYGIGFAPVRTSVPWSAAHAARLELLRRAWADGANELVLSDADVDALASGADERSEPLADALAALVSLSASSDAEFRVLVHSVEGPSGARLLGRLCAIDPTIHARVAAHLREEERLRPGVAFAEVLVLPKQHHRNATGRPVLRDYELSFACRSGAPEARRLPLADLMLAVEDERIVLSSERLGRELAPRLSCAINWDHPESHPVLRLLGALQAQDATELVQFDWGPLASARFLPRVCRGRAVLAVAQWRVPVARFGRARSAGDVAAFRRVQEVRAELRWPRFVSIDDADTPLAIDLDNPLCVDALLRVARTAGELRISEVFPAPHETSVRGPEGGYAHELIVPFVATRSPRRAAAPARVPAAALSARTRMPGTDWLYAKVYAGAASSDRLLCETLAPLMRRAIRSGAADRWFFVRYADPEPHLRVRVHGASQRLTAELLPAMAKALQRSLRERSVWRLQLDTYQREIERYGGVAALDIAERVFFRDSEAALRIIAEAPPLRERRHAAIVGTDGLLGALGLELSERARVVGMARDALARELDATSGARERNAFHRSERSAVAELFAARSAELTRLRRVYAARDAELARAGRRLRALERDEKLTSSFEAIASSYAHMHNNRLFPADQRMNELLVLELLQRHYRSLGSR